MWKGSRQVSVTDLYISCFWARGVELNFKRLPVGVQVSRDTLSDLGNKSDGVLMGVEHGCEPKETREF